MSDHDEKDEAIRRAAQSTQPEVALVLDGYCIVETSTLAQHEYNYGELIQLRAASDIALAAQEVARQAGNADLYAALEPLRHARSTGRRVPV